MAHYVKVLSIHSGHLSLNPWCEEGTSSTKLWPSHACHVMGMDTHACACAHRDTHIQSQRFRIFLFLKNLSCFQFPLCLLWLWLFISLPREAQYCTTVKVVDNHLRFLFRYTCLLLSVSLEVFLALQTIHFDTLYFSFRFVQHVLNVSSETSSVDTYAILRYAV